jgi:ribosomal protein S15P/S13E
MKVLKQTGNPILTKFAHVKNSKRSEGVTVKNFVETITNIDPHLKLKVRQVQR